VRVRTEHDRSCPRGIGLLDRMAPQHRSHASPDGRRLDEEVVQVVLLIAQAVEVRYAQDDAGLHILGTVDGIVRARLWGEGETRSPGLGPGCIASLPQCAVARMITAVRSSASCGLARRMRSPQPVTPMHRSPLAFTTWRPINLCASTSTLNDRRGKLRCD
jgi:hypothetical protein